MPYGDYIGSGTSQKIDVVCPKCYVKCEVLWFPPRTIAIRRDATTGGSEKAYSHRGERVEGECKECGYKFKPDDL